MLRKMMLVALAMTAMTAAAAPKASAKPYWLDANVRLFLCLREQG